MHAMGPYCLMKINFWSESLGVFLTVDFVEEYSAHYMKTPFERRMFLIHWVCQHRMLY